MDMKIDSAFIRAQREQRAWSQEHLAAVTGLGLRTIQRIETTGMASYESARALAAVFGVDVAELRSEAPAAASGSRHISVPLRPLLGVVAALAASGALLVARNTFADQALLDVSVALNTTNETREWLTQMVVDWGEIVPNVNDLRLEELRFSIVPKLLPDGRILIEMQIFERRGEEDVLVTAPRLVTADGEKIDVITGTDARSFRFSITPRRYSRPLL